MAAGLADDDGQLALVVEIARDPRAHHRLVMRDKSVDQPQEDLWVLRRRAARLGSMGAVIAAGTDDLVRVGDRRQHRDLRQSDIRCYAAALGRCAVQFPAGNSCAQGGIPIAEPAPEIDDTVPDHRAIRTTPRCRKADQFHPASSRLIARMMARLRYRLNAWERCP